MNLALSDSYGRCRRHSVHNPCRSHTPHGCNHDRFQAHHDYTFCHSHTPHGCNRVRFQAHHDYTFCRSHTPHGCNRDRFQARHDYTFCRFQVRFGCSPCHSHTYLCRIEPASFSAPVRPYSYYIQTPCLCYNQPRCHDICHIPYLQDRSAC